MKKWTWILPLLLLVEVEVIVVAVIFVAFFLVEVVDDPFLTATTLP